MFIILLKFSANRDQRAQYMDGHKAWIRQGFDDGVFILAGGLQPGLGGGILAQGTSAEALRARVDADPFVANDVVTAEIVEMVPSLADPRLDFLVG